MKKIMLKLDDDLYKALQKYTDERNSPTLPREFVKTPADAASSILRFYLGQMGFFKG